MHIVSVALFMTCMTGWAQAVTIVSDGNPMSKIVVSHNVVEQVNEAARTLAHYIEQASGAQLEVALDNEIGGYKGVAIWVGRTSLVEDKEIILEGLDEDGFVISASGNEVIICGPTPWGTEFGVYDFLERYVGVRWLLPGPDGDDVPVRSTISIPEGTVMDEPVFFSRLLSGLRGDWQTRWARLNRMHGRIKFHHNLLRVFPPETYTKTHPEFFPMKDGKSRYLPPTNNTHGWQPCFSAPGAIEEAANNIIQYFNDHPDEASFSLAVNDSSGHCRCPQCMAKLSGEKNFLGRMDYSDLYYGWCNQVIERVLKAHPDKRFGCLAYSEVAGPPRKIHIHPRLVPYMTYDRMKWIHPEVAAAGREVTEAWEKVSSTLGWYDYIYGTPYCLPRVYFRQAAEYLRYGYQHSVRAMYAEIYPNFGEGPKPYLYLKLWWNPNQDEDELLKEWYERCVGKEAAPYLKQYYSIWERFWTQDILQSQWFSVGGQYLRFNSPEYLADVKEEDILKSRELLDTCIAKCRTDKQRARAKLLEKAFQYYEASALAYLADEKSGTIAIKTQADAMAALDRAERAMFMAHKRRHLALNVYPNDQILVNPLNIERYGRLSGQNWGIHSLWSVMDWVTQDNSAVRKRLAELAHNSDLENAHNQVKLMLSIADGKITPISQNSSFEEGEETAATSWSYWVKPDPHTNRPVGRMLRDKEHYHTGNTSLLCDGMYRGGPVQTIDEPAPGMYCALAWVYVPVGQSSRGTVELVVTPRGEDGKNLPGFSSKVTPRSGEWILIVASGEIPQQIQGKEVTHTMLIPIVDGFADRGKVYWDDVAFYRIDITPSRQ